MSLVWPCGAIWFMCLVHVSGHVSTWFRSGSCGETYPCGSGLVPVGVWSCDLATWLWSGSYGMCHLAMVCVMSDSLLVPVWIVWRNLSVCHVVPVWFMWSCVIWPCGKSPSCGLDEPFGPVLAMSHVVRSGSCVIGVVVAMWRNLSLCVICQSSGLGQPCGSGQMVWIMCLVM